jgi:glucose-induced degradation protein 8
VISADGFKRDINYLVMDYLVTNGYPSAAKRFAVEANIQPKADVESIQERVEIRNAIHSGDIQTAIEKINELNHQVGDFNIFIPRTFFCYD